MTLHMGELEPRLSVFKIILQLTVYFSQISAVLRRSNGVPLMPISRTAKISDELSSDSNVFGDFTKTAYHPSTTSVGTYDGAPNHLR